MTGDGAAVGEEVSELGLRPSFQDELGREVEICARGHTIRDAAGEDCGGPFTPRSSQVKSQLRLPRTRFLSSRSTRLFVSSICPSDKNSTNRAH